MSSTTLHFIDLFCGIGGFHFAARDVGERTGMPLECVLASDIDPACRRQYAENFGLEPVGDIREIDAVAVPDHDLLFAGFPCQPFSIIGDRRGFADTRGTLFFEIARILAAKVPRAFVLENVKQLRGHDGGRTLGHIEQVLRDDLGYHVDWKVLDARDFGLPQKRERLVIVGFRDRADFEWPSGRLPMAPLKDLLERDVPNNYFASQHIRGARSKWHEAGAEPTIWHENKSGNVSKYPYSCALRAGASYNYLLVDGVRRLTERELLRLQGFPEEFRVVGSYSDIRKQTGNAVPVPLCAAVIERVVAAIIASSSRSDAQIA